MTSLSSSRRPWRYHVFLSFRGEDTRRTIVSHLYSGLTSKGIVTFKDDRKLRTGDSIPDELVKAIEESRFAVVVISENYASSGWCLDELQKIMERKEEGVLTVVPIFYEVDPSDVRHQKGTFAEAFEKHNARKKAEKVQKWREALSEVASLSGVDSRRRPDDATVVSEIVRDISDRLLSMLPRDSNDIVGMDAHMKALAPLLSMGSDDEVRMIGIWGMGGIGKTTIANFLYNKYKCQFPFHCFIDAVKKTCSEDGLVYLQGRFLSEVLHEQNIKLQNLEAGSSAIKERLHRQKVLTILDDVDQLDQLHALAKESGWFGPGSRIIVTTRDKGLLISHNIKLVYEVSCLGDDAALELFNHFAFGKALIERQPPHGYMQLSVRASKLVQGLPLALKVLGSFLQGKKTEQWEAATRRLREVPLKSVMESLKVSYDGLHERDKGIFLAVACLFNERHVSHVSQLLDGKEWEVSDSLNTLAEKSLIDICNDGQVIVHDLIQEMAKEIICLQSISEPGRRTFLWDPEEIYNVLEDETGTDAVEGISFLLSKIPELPTGSRAFGNMPNLRFLRIRNRTFYGNDLLQIRTTFNYFPRRLRLLDWNLCPLTTLPSTFHAEYLVELCLPFSNLEKLWEGTLFLRNLRKMDLNSSYRLKEIPDLSQATNLEELDISFCFNLVGIPWSFSSLKRLTKLSVRCCERLELLPSTTGLESLKVLDAGRCESLKSFPELSESTIELNLSGTKIVEVPESIQNLTALEILDLSHCEMLSEISSMIGNLTALQKLDLSYGSMLRKIPNTIGNLITLRQLDLRLCKMLMEIPSTVGNLTALEKLNLAECSSLMHIPNAIGNLTALQELVLRSCTMLTNIPSTIGSLTALRELDLGCCTMLLKIPSTIGNLTALEELDMRCCTKLSYVPNTIGNLTSLQKLNFVSDMPIEIPSTIGHLAVLRELAIMDCKMLAWIPSTIGNLIALRKLKLSNCEKLKKIPGTVGTLIVLQELHISNCEMLSGIPSTIGNLTALEKLYITDCENLINIPDTVGNLAALLSLRVTSCKMLAEIPSTIGNLTALEELTLMRCEKLMYLPNTIGNLTTLQKVNLSGCKTLSGIPSIIGTLTSLKCLYAPADVNCVQNLANAIQNLKRFHDLIDSRGIVEFCHFQGRVDVVCERGQGDHASVTLCCKRKSEFEYNWPQRKSDFEYNWPQRKSNFEYNGPLQFSSLSSFRHFRTLSLLYLNILELPDDLGCLQALRGLDLSGNDFETIPASIKQLSLLEKLVLFDCKNLRSMPEFPPHLKYLYAHRCSSLESINDISRHCFQELMLSDCFKVDRDASLLVEHMVCSMPNHTGEVKKWACLSGSQLPNFFNHQSRELSLTISRPQIYSGCKLVGFVAGFVVNCDSPRHEISDLIVGCRWHIEANKAGHTHLNVDNYLPSHALRCCTESDLVLVSACNFHDGKHFDKISFYFELRCCRSALHRTNCCTIKRCGIHLCFTKEQDQVQSLLPLEIRGISAEDILRNRWKKRILRILNKSVNKEIMSLSNSEEELRANACNQDSLNFLARIRKMICCLAKCILP